jgi:2-methylcitrate dehydratase PrpD
VLHRFIECSLGNVRRPLSDQQLEEKFRDQARVREVDKLINLCWRLDEIQDLNELVSATLS